MWEISKSTNYMHRKGIHKARSAMMRVGPFRTSVENWKRVTPTKKIIILNAKRNPTVVNMETGI